MGLAPDDRRRISEAPVARLATVRPDGRPHVVPVTFALVAEDVVTAVDHKPKRTTRLQRLRNLEARPFASVIVDHYEEDWARLWWARGDGAARVVPGGLEWERAVGQLVAKYDQYRERPPQGPVIVVAVERWTSWSGAAD